MCTELTAANSDPAFQSVLQSPSLTSLTQHLSEAVPVLSPLCRPARIPPQALWLSLTTAVHHLSFLMHGIEQFIFPPHRAFIRNKVPKSQQRLTDSLLWGRPVYCSMFSSLPAISTAPYLPSCDHQEFLQTSPDVSWTKTSPSKNLCSKPLLASHLQGSISS